MFGEPHRSIWLLIANGVSKEKLAYDLAHGFTDENPTTSENKPVIDPTRAGAANPTLTDGTNHAHIDQFGKSKTQTCMWLDGTLLTINTSIFSLWTTILGKN